MTSDPWEPTPPCADLTLATLRENIEQMVRDADRRPFIRQSIILVPIGGGRMAYVDADDVPFRLPEEIG